ncbi:integrase [Rhodoferax sp. OV413]|uniref:integrase n=1 Tax=Rhodoferax sp. OV413 TaxID=1855285 RepID=UPI00115FE655|nr:integrase [Rhodoferax sp. OV413]
MAELVRGRDVNLQKVQPCGALMARKRSSGSVLFFWRTTYQGELVRLDVGIYSASANRAWKMPAEDGRYSVAAALFKASEYALEHVKALPAGGILGSRRRAVEEGLKAVAQAQADREALENHTLAHLSDLYWQWMRDKGRQTWNETKNALGVYVLSNPLAKKPASQITDEDIADILRPIYGSKKGRQANKVRSYLHAAFALAAKARVNGKLVPAFKELNVRFNPVSTTLADQEFNGVDKNPLNVDEMRLYWLQIKEIPGKRGAALRLHLLSGAPRIAQFVRARWSELDDEGVTLWDTKGRPGSGARKHKLPMLLEAEDALSELTRVGPFLFSTNHGKTHISNTTLSNWAKEAAGEKIRAFTMKRVRSGVETLLSSLKVDEKHRGHLQSHGISGVQSKHYDAHDYLDEKYDALEVLYDALTRDEAPMPKHVQKRRQAARERARMEEERAQSLNAQPAGDGDTD